MRAAHIQAGRHVTTEITLMGDVAVRRVGAPVGSALVGAHPRVALARLMLGPADGVERAELAEVIWPAGPPRTWPSALRTVGSQIRRFLAVGMTTTDPLTARDGRYVLRLPHGTTTDLARAAERIRHAEAHLDRGEPSAARDAAAEAVPILTSIFLPGVTGPWVDEQRERIADTAVSALELLSRAALAAGDPAAALAAADDAAARAPLRESAHRCRMAAHAAAGNRGEALAVYQQLRRTLIDRFGIDPSPETEAAYLDLLGSHDPVAATPRSPRTSPTGPMPFVGRDEELASLADAWDQVQAGRGHLVLITGETGIGKTRLATEAARQVTAEEGLVLFGRCDRASAIPYQPFVEVFDAYIAATPADELPPLGERALAALAAVLPSLGVPRRMGGNDSRAVLFDATAALMRAVAADRPLLMVLDDLQWADDDTLLLLRHLVRHAGGARVLVIAIAREDRGAQLFDDVVGALDHDGWVRQVPLGGLAEAAVRVLLHAALDDRDRDLGTLARRLVGETAGNPFLLGELVRAGGGNARHQGDGELHLGEGVIPPSVKDLVAGRLAGLSRDSVDLLRAAAVAGGRFDLDLAAATAGLDERATLDGIDEALASGLVVEETPDRYRFQHDIVRRALEAQLGGARRRVMHRRLADAIEQQRPDATQAHAVTLAHHAAAGARRDGDLRAVRLSRLAAEQVAGRSAFAESVRLCRQALDHVPSDDGPLQAEVMTDLGVALARAGDGEAGTTLLDAAMLARRHHRPDVLARAVLHIADLAAETPDLRIEALDLVETALRATGHGPGDTDVGAMPTGTPPALFHARLLIRQHRLLDATGTDAATRVPREAIAALRARLTELTGPDHIDQRHQLGDELAVLADLADDAAARFAAVHERAMVFAFTDDVVASDAALQALVATAGESGDLAARELVAAHRAAQGVQQGRFADAVTAATGNATAARNLWVVRWLLDPAAHGAGGMAVDGSASPAWADPDAASAEEPRDDAELAVHLALTGQPERARLVVRELVAGLRPLPTGDDRLHALGLVAFVVAELGDPSLATSTQALLAPHADLRCGAGYLSFAGAAAFHLGRLAALRGDWGDAERHLLAALRHHAGLQARPWVALTQAALADVLDARGRPSDREWIAALRSEAAWVTADLGMRALRTGTGSADPSPDPESPVLPGVR